MAISEESRHRLYGRLEEVLGRESAATLMEHLPPVGWADVATKRDLDHLAEVLRGQMAAFEARVESRFAGLDARVDTGLASVEARMEAGLARAALDTRAGLRTLFLGLVGLQLSGAGLALAVARLG